MYAVVLVQKSAPSMQVKGNVLLARAEIRAGDNVVCMIFSKLRACVVVKSAGRDMVALDARGVA